MMSLRRPGNSEWFRELTVNARNVVSQNGCTIGRQGRPLLGMKENVFGVRDFRVIIGSPAGEQTFDPRNHTKPHERVYGSLFPDNDLRFSPAMTFYVTTPIYYANSLPHLGHLYTMIVADAVARHKRQQGIETFFLTGTDEHGINIERAAQKAGRTPKEQADYVVGYYKKMTSEFGLDAAHGGYDIFMRTSEPFHYQGVSEFWRRAAKAKTPKGHDAIYKGHY